MDYIQAALKLQELMEKDISVLNITPAIQSGERTPKAEFVVVTMSGEVLRVTVKRQSAGIEGTVAKKTTT